VRASIEYAGLNKSVVGTHVQSTPMALRVLAEMGPAASEAVTVLASALDKHANPLVPEALGLIGPAAEDAVPALEKALDSWGRNVRVAAAEALWRITGKTDKAVPILLRIAQEKLWDRYLRPVRRRAVEVLGAMGPAARDAVPVLTRLTEDEDPDIRQAAVDALRKIRTEGE
jgi:HEAT repeat protein